MSNKLTYVVKVVRADAGALVEGTAKAAHYEVLARSVQEAEGAAEGYARKEFGGKWISDGVSKGYHGKWD